MCVCVCFHVCEQVCVLCLDMFGHTGVWMLLCASVYTPMCVWMCVAVNQVLGAFQGMLDWHQLEEVEQKVTMSGLGCYKDP